VLPSLKVIGSGEFNNGSLAVTFDIHARDVILSGGDCAEDFDVVDSEAVESGSVMVIDDEGTLRTCQEPYDKRVAGIVSGAGGHRPGVTLDRQTEFPAPNRLPIALVGKVHCKADARYGRIMVGDLLTTSPTPGHAMRADPVRAFGAVIGKALRPLEAGRALIPILVALQYVDAVIGPAQRFQTLVVVGRALDARDVSKSIIIRSLKMRRGSIRVAPNEQSGTIFQVALTKDSASLGAGNGMKRVTPLAHRFNGY
jgi:hypothetical protein